MEDEDEDEGEDEDNLTEIENRNEAHRTKKGGGRMTH
jgi:hypothetical protein